VLHRSDRHPVVTGTVATRPPKSGDDPVYPSNPAYGRLHGVVF
jgi:hypothetical protein